jgi:hypothetical protein
LLPGSQLERAMLGQDLNDFIRLVLEPSCARRSYTIDARSEASRCVVDPTEARAVAGSGPDDRAVRHGRVSDIDPVGETIDDGEMGRLAGFVDAEGFGSRAIELLREPARIARWPIGPRR